MTATMRLRTCGPLRLRQAGAQSSSASRALAPRRGVCSNRWFARVRLASATRAGLGRTSRLPEPSLRLEGAPVHRGTSLPWPDPPGRHLRSPRCTGGLLRGLVTVTPGLSLPKSRPDSRRDRLADDDFSGHTMPLLGGRVFPNHCSR